MLQPIPEGKMYNFFIDDNVFFLHDIQKHAFKSIFDSFYLNGLREIHEEFGTCFTLNCFSRNWHDPEKFSIAQVSDSWRSEFEDNASWLRFAFHGDIEYPERPYSTAYPEKLPEHYKFWHDNMVRIAGEKSIIAPVIFHFFDATDDCRRFMRAQGMKFMAQHSSTGGGIVCDPAFDQYMIPVDIILNLFYADLAGIRRTLETAAAAKDQILIGSHEQYAYRGYENYIPEYFEQIRTACSVMAERGFRSVYFNELV